MPRTLAQNAQYIAETIKPAIKSAIEAQGVTVPSTDSFLDYADRIGEIEGGGSGYQLKDLPTGAIATVTDAAPLPLNALKVSVEAWQEGTGDPSPSNVRPIHGWSEAEININNYPSGYYGIIIHQAVSDPKQRIEYTGINANYTPMSQSDGVVSYGDWGNMPTLTMNKPAMIKRDGTFGYWLDEDDYSKKEDGVTASDVADMSYDGNAFAWFPAMWMKIIESGTDLEVRFAYSQLEPDYYEVCPSGSEGVWLPMFYGCPDSNGYMRSIADTNCLGGRTYINTADAQETAIKKNGNDYYFLGGKLLNCITLLEMMWFKTTNSDDIGRGNQDGYNASAADGRYGTKSNPIVGGGQFYLTNDGKTANKILHCLPLAAYDVWLRNPYFIVDNGTYKVSKDYSYDTSGATLTNTGLTIPSQGYIKELVYVNGYGLLPKTTGGSTTTYYCDHLWVNTSIVSVPFSFGDCYYGRNDGFRSAACTAAAGYSNWDFGCALVLKQSKGKQYTLNFPQTIYGAEWDVVNGEMKQTDGYIASYNGETLPSTWISDRDVYASGTTPTIGAEVVYKLATPQTIQLSPLSIRLLQGTNNVYADCGDILEGEYFVDEGAIDVRKVDYQIGSSGSIKTIDGRVLSGFASMNGYHARPLDASGNWLDVDWSKDFEIGVAFKFTAFPAYQGIIGDGNANSYRKAPRLYYDNSEGKLALCVSSDGSTLAIDQYLNYAFATDKWYFIKAKFVLSTMAFSVDISDDFATFTNLYTGTMSNAPYHNAASLCFGGDAQQSNMASNTFLIDTFNTYIKGDGVNWGASTGAFPS